MITRREIYVAGAWRVPHGREVLEVENPTTEQPAGIVTLADAHDVDHAVAAARSALPAWSSTSPRHRGAVLRSLHRTLAARRDVLARTIATEMGCPMRIATRIQADLPLTVIDAYAHLAETYPFEQQVANSTVLHEPIGVVAAITPWNYPLHQIVCKLAAALAAGCTMVVKPSELSPLVAYLLFEALDEAGLPAGVVNLAPGRGGDVGESLIGHPGVDMVSFTGSTRTGARVASVAGASMKKVALELGGKSANVILDDADWRTAVKVGVANAFLNSGQTCTAWTRMLVHDNRYDEAVAYAAEIAANNSIGDPLDVSTRLGPLVSAAQRERVLGYITTAMTEGARVATGGTRRPEGLERGHFVAPTVLAEVDPDSTVAQEEIFGPVLSVLSFRDDDEALAIANNSRYGLAGAVWSGDRDRALGFARQMQTGSIDVNGGAYNPLAPFGGYKFSGVGREMGRAGLEEFLQTKAIQL